MDAHAARRRMLVLWTAMERASVGIVTKDRYENKVEVGLRWWECVQDSCDSESSDSE